MLSGLRVTVWEEIWGRLDDVVRLWSSREAKIGCKVELLEQTDCNEGC